MILDIYNTLPNYALFLLWWPLPSFCSALFLIRLLKKDLNRLSSYTKKEAEETSIFLSIVWPIFAIIIITVIPTLFFEFIEKTRQHFKKRLKQQPESQPQKEYIHRGVKNRTVCGVGNPNTVKRAYVGPITCPLCIGIIKRNSHG